MKIDVEIPKDINNGRVKGKSKPANSRARKMTTSFSRGFGTVSFSGALADPIIRFFCRDATSPSSIKLRPEGVRLRGFLRDGVTPPLRSHA
jgi:hypothetical protein